jgi:predicted acyl esterase
MRCATNQPGRLPAQIISVSILKLRPGEIVAVDIEMCPSSTFFAAGETLQLIIASHDIVASPPYIKSLEGNFGRHVICAGGVYDS